MKETREVIILLYYTENTTLKQTLNRACRTAQRLDLLFPFLKLQDERALVAGYLFTTHYCIFWLFLCLLLIDRNKFCRNSLAESFG